MNKLYKVFLEEDYQKILKLIAKKRVEKGLTQWDFASRLHLTESGYFKIEKGISRLDIMRFLVILNILEITVQDFFNELDKTTPLAYFNKSSLTKNKD